jgi:UDPglucose 6-dehydrogenase
MGQQGISIVGLGYVGLCTAVGFASKGNKIIAVDKDPEKINLINKGLPPFYEPDLNAHMQEATKGVYLKYTLDTKESVLNTEVTFITVGTPSKADGSIDLKQIQESAIEIGKALNKKSGYHLIVVKSTVLPGTTENMIKPILEKESNKQCGSGFGLCMNPEFLREGSAFHDTLHPDRVIIGEYDKESGDELEELYRKFYAEKNPPTIRTNLPTAELIKYANNAFLATKISYINTIANICEKIPGTDVTKVAEAIGLDHRISPRFLSAGLGYGGSCFPKDLKALIAFSKQQNYLPSIFQAVQKVNDDQAKHAIELVKRELADLSGKKVAILGLSFKPDTDDMREARSVQIINQLLDENANVIAYDPFAVSNAKAIFKNKISYASSAISCLKDADCCIIVTEWEEFKQLKPEDFTQNMSQPILIDGRRVYNPKRFSKKLRFYAIGLGQ